MLLSHDLSMVTFKYVSHSWLIKSLLVLSLTCSPRPTNVFVISCAPCIALPYRATRSFSNAPCDICHIMRQAIGTHTSCFSSCLWTSLTTQSSHCSTWRHASLIRKGDNDHRSYYIMEFNSFSFVFLAMWLSFTFFAHQIWIAFWAAPNSSGSSLIKR